MVHFKRLMIVSFAFLVIFSWKIYWNKRWSCRHDVLNYSRDDGECVLQKHHVDQTLISAEHIISMRFFYFLDYTTKNRKWKRFADSNLFSWTIKQWVVIHRIEWVTLLDIEFFFFSEKLFLNDCCSTIRNQS